MMLHEAVMLEIYRQALHASEMASPRCQSRESSGGGRCPSDESIRSEAERDGQNSGPNMSPVSITLPPTLPPGAAAALLPQHSAAMAAYLNVAAVAAQQNRLLLGSPLAGLAAARNGSPPILPPLASPTDESDDAALDFSKKRSDSGGDDDAASDDGEDDRDAVNLSAKSGENSPLDLSCSTRKRTGDDSNSPPPRKASRPLDYKQQIVTPWSSPVTPQLPYFAAAVAAAGLSPKNNHTDWNGKHKGGISNEAAKALEKMTEMSRLGGEEIYRPSSNNNNSGGGGATAGGGRHSAWQSHWLNKGADSAKDVLKCVWCKQSFPSLAAMTTHMKETKHCGVNVPPGTGMPQQPIQQQQPPNSSASNTGHSASNKPSPSELNLLIKETMPLPRKLVRGQDVWLGKGAEQTRQILKCMWCGQSFRTLAEMTSHMQQTQHYTNIISQEQIISWKSTDGEKPGSGPPGPSGNATTPSGSTSAPANAQANSHVSAVLTCKVCDQAFTSLKELSNHMVKNAHYKEHIMRSITESGGRRRQTREKRKKSLPVRKLLEMERAQHDFKNGETPPPNAGNKPIRDLGAGKITCEKCNEKIETTMFVDHIRQCIGGTAILQAQQQREKLKNALLSNTIIPPDSISPVTPTSRDGRKSVGDDLSSPLSLQKSPMPADLSSPASTKKDGSGGGGGGEKSSSPSVLNAIEQLIEKSFDTRSRHPSTNFGNANQAATPLGSSILKRLGIDESVDYTKPLVDPQTMNLLRSYHQQQYVAQFGRRERSGSESSSISERGSSRVDSLTPEKKFDTPSHSTPRGTPEKQYMDDHMNSGEQQQQQQVNIKREMNSDDEDEDDKHEPPKIKIKREMDEDEEDGSMRPPSKSHEDDTERELKRRSSVASSPAPSPRLSTASVPLSPAASPISDHHSITSRSTPGAAAPAAEGSSKKSVSSSLGALSSMFDSLTGSGNAGNAESSGTGKKSSAHPLAALQKLCDKTENTPGAGRGGSSSALLSATPNAQSSRTAPGAILAFSWACNDAVVSDESVIKCAYCDTTFTSKGAYRHHLSKAHFVNDDVIPDPKGGHKPGSPHSPKSTGGRDSVSRGDGGGTPIPPPQGGSSGGNGSARSPAPPQSPAGAGGAFDESPHSKFLKYTELAKQLSSKYV
ncbi:protein tiptop isoform X2 [Culex pipiens pallens]|uniref:protein tiptop isoform X2 n=1 Tax=Culex pipiens pallens TaxID=42434 RepID=UPI0019548A20|nr:protein tiptop isoform X2 [Culex pipiens pallens]